MYIDLFYIYFKTKVLTGVLYQKHSTLRIAERAPWEIRTLVFLRDLEVIHI